MELATWANILSAIGTVTAAGVAAYSARLAWRQVRYQFEPRLLIPSRQFQIKMAASSLKDVFWEKPTEAAAYVNGGDTDYRFLIQNIGNGAAYDIKIATELDFEALFADTQNKINAYASAFEVAHDGFGVQLTLDGKLIGGFRLPDEAASHVDWVGSGPPQDSIRPCGIDPSLAFFALCLAFYLMHERIGGGVTQPEQIIKFAFIVTYTDPSGKRQTRRIPKRLIVRGGRWQSDLSDGLALVTLAPA